MTDLLVNLIGILLMPIGIRDEVDIYTIDIAEDAVVPRVLTPLYDEGRVEPLPFPRRQGK